MGIKETFKLEFGKWVTALNLQPGDHWVSLTDLHANFMSHVEVPVTITRHRLGRGLTQPSTVAPEGFKKALRSKPLQTGYLVNRDDLVLSNTSVEVETTEVAEELVPGVHVE